MVLTTQDVSISEPVTFVENVNVTDLFKVANDLNVRFIKGCDLQQWYEDAVYLDTGFIPGNLHFENIQFECYFGQQT